MMRGGEKEVVWVGGEGFEGMWLKRERVSMGGRVVYGVRLGLKEMVVVFEMEKRGRES